MTRDDDMRTDDRRPRRIRAAVVLCPGFRAAQTTPKRTREVRPGSERLYPGVTWTS